MTRLLFMHRVCHGGVGREIIDGISLIHPPVLVVGRFFWRHGGWQHSVVVNVVPVVARLVGDDELLEPFHATASDLARNDGS